MSSEYSCLICSAFIIGAEHRISRDERDSEARTCLARAWVEGNDPKAATRAARSDPELWLVLLISMTLLAIRNINVVLNIR